MEIVTAIGRGFSPENAMTLLKGENTLTCYRSKGICGKICSSNQVERIKGRIIGEGGRARRNMENLSGTYISVYGKTVSIIGDASKLNWQLMQFLLYQMEVCMAAVYNKLESANRKR